VVAVLPYQLLNSNQMTLHEQKLYDRLVELSEDMLSYGEMMDNAYIRLKSAEIEAVTRELIKTRGL
jgi:hypothetical protein